MKIFDLFKPFALASYSSDKVPTGLCPNCWGRQEYQGAFYTTVKNEEITTKNIDQKRGWIEGYVEKNLLGIKLVSHEEGLICNHCHTKYVAE